MAIRIPPGRILVYLDDLFVLNLICSHCHHFFGSVVVLFGPSVSDQMPQAIESITVHDGM